MDNLIFLCLQMCDPQDVAWGKGVYTNTFIVEEGMPAELGDHWTSQNCFEGRRIYTHWYF